MVKRSPRLKCATSMMPAGLKNVLFVACFNVQTSFIFIVYVNTSLFISKWWMFWEKAGVILGSLAGT